MLEESCLFSLCQEKLVFNIILALLKSVRPEVYTFLDPFHISGVLKSGNRHSWGELPNLPILFLEPLFTF